MSSFLNNIGGLTKKAKENPSLTAGIILSFIALPIVSIYALPGLGFAAGAAVLAGTAAGCFILPKLLKGIFNMFFKEPEPLTFKEKVLVGGILLTLIAAPLVGIYLAPALGATALATVGLVGATIAASFLISLVTVGISSLFGGAPSQVATSKNDDEDDLNNDEAPDSSMNATRKLKEPKEEDPGQIKSAKTSASNRVDDSASAKALIASKRAKSEPNHSAADIATSEHGHDAISTSAMNSQ